MTCRADAQALDVADCGADIPMGALAGHGLNAMLTVSG